MRPPEQSNFKSVPLPKQQSTVARCTTVIDIGTVQETFKNETKIMRKLWIGWELPKLLAVFNEDAGEQPFNIGIEVTYSTDDRSNFSKLVSNWRNKPLDSNEQKSFDPKVMINKTALISFIHKRKGKYKDQPVEQVTNENSVLKFNGISQLPEGLVCPPMVSKKVVWDWDDIADGTEAFDKVKFEHIPKWIREKMMTSEEFRKYGKGYDEAEGTDLESNDEPIADDTTEGGW